MLVTTLTVSSQRTLAFPSDSTGTLSRTLTMTAVVHPTEDVAAASHQLLSMVEKLLLGHEQGLKDTTAFGGRLTANAFADSVPFREPMTVLMDTTRPANAAADSKAAAD